MDNFLWITRKDLGVLWGVSRRDNTYMEDKLAPAGAPAQTPRKDIHTLGWDFGLGPVDWTMETTRETKAIRGISCEHVIARGRPVTIVDMKFTRIPTDPTMKDEPFQAERTVLILVHELFRCFQADDDRAR